MKKIEFELSNEEYQALTHLVNTENSIVDEKTKLKVFTPELTENSRVLLWTREYLKHYINSLYLQKINNSLETKKTFEEKMKDLGI